MDPGPPPSAETLLQHAGFVRGLARSMLGDTHAAEDVVQETLLAGARNPPRDPGKLRSWMGSVARNLSLRTRRDVGRRKRREHAVARPEGLPGTAEVVAQLDLQRRVVAEVERLDEPYRSTVVHRFFHAHTVREIAKAEGITIKAVESRLARALKTLRSRLDRPGVAGALALLAWPQPAGAAVITAGGVSAVGITSKVGLMVVVLLVLAAGSISGLAWMDGQEARSERSTRATVDDPARTIPAFGPAPPANEPAREPAPSPVPPPSVWKQGVVSGRVGWEGQEIPAGTKLILIDIASRQRSSVVQLTAEPRPNGTFRFENVRAGNYHFFATAPGYAPWASGYTHRVGPQTPHLKLDARLLKGATLRLTVRDSAGRKQRGLLVAFSGSKAPMGVEVSISSDDEGNIELPHLSRGRLDLTFQLPGGGEQRWIMGIAGEGYSNFKRIVEREIIIDNELGGILRGPDGKPLAGMSVTISDSSGFQAKTTSDAEGRYVARGLQAGQYDIVASRTALAVIGGRVHVARAPRTRHDIACEPGAILGRLEGTAGGKTRASVNLSGARFVRVPMKQETEFAIWNVSAGSYKLWPEFGTSGVAQTVLRLELGEREVRDDIVFTLSARQHGEVDLEIRGKDGTLVERAQFIVEIAGGSTSMAPPSHAPGRFRLKLETGRRDIKIRCGQSGLADIRVAVEPGRMVFKSVQLK